MRSVSPPGGRYICTDTVLRLRRVYRWHTGTFHATEHPLTYIWNALPTYACCTCGSCAGWRGVS